jgi:hypothetical protein
MAVTLWSNRRKLWCRFPGGHRVGASWMWTLAFGRHEDCTPTHGYAATRDDAMAAFAKSWRRE